MAAQRSSNWGSKKLYVKVAGALMVVCLLYGALSLAGIIR